MSYNEEEEGIKVIFIGEAGVGKTSLLKSIFGIKFNSEERSTLTSSYSTKNMKVDGEEYIFHLWDTIGTEKFRSLTKMFFKNSKIVILVYDITNEKSFKELNYWYKQVKNELGEDEFTLIIVGNKKDLFNLEEVRENKGKEYANNRNAKFKLSSAKTYPLSFIKFIDEIFIEYIDNNKDKLNKHKKTSLYKSNKKIKKRRCC